MSALSSDADVYKFKLCAMDISTASNLSNVKYEEHGWGRTIVCHGAFLAGFRDVIRDMKADRMLSGC